MIYVMFALSAFFLLLAQHPFITYPLSLAALRLFRPHKIVGNAVPLPPESFAICVCAYNEEAVIRQKAENLLAIRRLLPGTELLIYVDAASDSTAEILSDYAQEITVHISPQRLGKTHGMNLLASKTGASILVFTDANVMLDEQCLARLAPYFNDPRTGCVCGHLQYVNEEESVTAKTGSLYWKLEEWIKQAESDTGSLMGADGSLFAIRRTLHHAPPDHLIDDMFVSLSILCDGYRVVRAPEAMAYEKSATSQNDEFQRKVRIACQAFNVHKTLWPRLRKLDALNLYKYISHKLLRWFVICWLILAASCFLAGVSLLGYPLTAVAFVLVFAGVLLSDFRLKYRFIGQIADILLAFIASGLGIFRSLRQEHFQTWSPAASVRQNGQESR